MLLCTVVQYNSKKVICGRRLLLLVLKKKKMIDVDWWKVARENSMEGDKNLNYTLKPLPLRGWEPSGIPRSIISWLRKSCAILSKISDCLQHFKGSPFKMLLYFVAFGSHLDHRLRANTVAMITVKGITVKKIIN